MNLEKLNLIRLGFVGLYLGLSHFLPGIVASIAKNVDK